MKSRQLSTIEMTVLGIAWLRGPCTTYAVMKELATSESTYYKSRAGTAYSVVERLTRFGLIELLTPTHEREDKFIQATAAGVSAIHAWLTPPIPIADIAHSADLVRLRFFFLGVLDPAERVAFVDNALEGLRAHLTRCEELVGENEAMGDRFGALATLSIVLETKARIEWLETVRSQL